MPEFGTVYTGKQAGNFPIPGFEKTQRASEQALSRILGAGEKVAEQARKQEQDLLEALKIDPIALASKKTAERQAQRLQEYDDKWTNIYADRRGGLTIADKVEMQSDRQAMIAKQSQWQAAQDEYYKAWELYARNPSKYDEEHFRNATQTFMKDGSSPEGGYLTEAPMAYDDYLKGLNLIANGGAADFKDSGGLWQPDPQSIGQGLTDVKYVSKWDYADARRKHRGWAFGTEATEKSVQNEWKKVPYAVQRQYMERADRINKENRENGVLFETNAILEYDWDKNKGMFLDPRSGGVRNEPRSTSADRKNKSDGAYSVQEGLSGIIGTNLTGLKVDMSKYAVTLPLSLIDKNDLPDDFIKEGDYVDAKIAMIANGEVEWNFIGKGLQEVSQEEAVDVAYDEIKKGYKEKNGKYYKEIKKNFIVKTKYSDVSGRVANALPDIKDAVEQNGFDQYTEKTQSAVKKDGIISKTGKALKGLFGGGGTSQTDDELQKWIEENGGEIQ